MEVVALILTKEIQCWGVMELTLKGPLDGNPFTDIHLRARFEMGQHVVEAEGFYDSDGIYRIRFMPEELGSWTYTTMSNCLELDGIKGEFKCTGASSGNHGPVRVKDRTHFHYADGTHYTPIGTTSYGWHLQSAEIQKQTLRTLQGSPFNKLRMCILPNSSIFNHTEPAMYPFEGTREQGFDYARFHTPYFAQLEKSVQALAELGIEAELVLFHPYDEGRWSFDSMSSEEDERYVRYCVARLGAYHNVWWSLANEYHLMKHKQIDDWNWLFRVIQENDYGRHLRTIHGPLGYDFGVPWITHASIRHGDVKVASECTKQYGKPVIIDDCGCEGNLDTRWGSLTPEDLLSRIWEGICRGGYVTHGEAYLKSDQELWYSHGGELHGESAAKIEFLRGIIQEAPDNLEYSSDRLDAATLEVRGEYYLQYFGIHRFAFREFALPEGRYTVDIIDTWNMTVTPLEGTFEGRFRIDLPAKLYYAIRIQKSSNPI